MFLVFGLAKAQDPDPPIITHVSIDSVSQQVKIYWYNNTPTVVGYIIYFQDASGLWIPLDTVNGHQNLSYTTQASNSQFERETYSIVAFDALGNSSSRSESHSTLYLKYMYTLCDSICELKWDLYPEMLNQGGFKIRVNSKNLLGGGEQESEVFLSSNDTAYSYLVEYGTKYTFTLIAYNSLDSLSRSNRFAITTTQIIPPDYAYINRVSVSEEQNIEVSILSNSSFVSYFELYRTTFEGGLKKHIADVPVMENSLFAKYLDREVLADRSLYNYSVKAVDICGKSYILPSSPDTNMQFDVHQLKLNSIGSNPDYFPLSWGDYSFFMDETVFQLWLEVNGNKELVRPASPNSYGDLFVKQYVGRICSYLLAFELAPNSLGLQDTVYSNKVCITKEPLLYFPSAFTPSNGDLKNNGWKPSILGKEAISSYMLKIFNRWGVLIKQINEPSDFWDGFYNGKTAEVGAYSYHLQFTYGEGQAAERKGIIMLLR